jgi:hypothetical protein
VPTGTAVITATGGSGGGGAGGAGGAGVSSYLENISQAWFN